MIYTNIYYYLAPLTLLQRQFRMMPTSIIRFRFHDSYYFVATGAIIIGLSLMPSSLGVLAEILTNSYVQLKISYFGHHVGPEVIQSAALAVLDQNSVDMEDHQSHVPFLDHRLIKGCTCCRKTVGDKHTLKLTCKKCNEESNETGNSSVVTAVNQRRGAHPPTMRQRNRYASHLATKCRLACVGVEKNTKANELVARHYLGKQMEQDNVRITHRLGILNRALLFIITPTEDDIYVRQMAQAPSVLDKYEAGTIRYHSRGPRTIWAWFGFRRSRAEPAGA
jgi:hypothetical protein